MIDHIVDDMVKVAYEETEEGTLIGEDGIVYAVQPRSSSKWEEEGGGRSERVDSRNINPINDQPTDIQKEPKAPDAFLSEREGLVKGRN